jgi:uncharacterized membrane protein YbhN (UPF0104 family)
MKRFNVNRLLRIFGTIVAIGLLLYLLGQQGWNEILESVRRIPRQQLIFGAILMLASRLAVATRWHILLRSVEVPISVRESVKITFAGLFASNFLPTTIGGDVVRLAMASSMGLDRVTSAASLVVDRLVGMLGMASAAPLGLTPIIGNALMNLDEFANVSSSLSVISLSNRLLRKTRRVFQRLFEASALWVKSPKGLLISFFITWIHMLCIFGTNWLMLIGQGETVPFWLAGGLWSFTYFVTLLPISINGLGVQELSMTFIFSNWGGVSVQGAATAALLVRTLQMLASVPGTVYLPDVMTGIRRTGLERQRPSD